MKKSLLFFSLCLFPFFFMQAQEVYHLDGEDLPLITEVKGPLNLLWYKKDKEYRFFSKKNDELIELKNTRLGRENLEEFKDVLETHADHKLSAKKTKLNLRSLNAFYTRYNQDEKDGMHARRSPARLGIYGGMDNVVFTANPNDANHPYFGIELELVDYGSMRRHAFVFQYKNLMEVDEHKYSASQFSFNYRFKFIQTSRFDMYVNTKVATFTMAKSEIEVEKQGDLPPMDNYIIKTKGLSAPFIFGVGADLRVGKGYLGFAYNDVVSLGMDSNGKTPRNFSLGYRFML